MDYLNLHTSTLDDEKLATAEAAHRSTWLHLTRYCIGQENGGQIEACADWSERKWLLCARVTPTEVKTPSELWTWDGPDLAVWGYPSDKEREVRAKRRAALATNKKRWASESLSDTDSDSGKEGKGREGKGRGKGKPSDAVFSLFPTDRMAAIGALKHRQSDTAWSKKEIAAMHANVAIAGDAEHWQSQIAPLAAYYGAPLARLRQYWGKPIDGTDDFRRRDLLTLLNNWAGELDRAREFVAWEEKFRSAGDAARL